MTSVPLPMQAPQLMQAVIAETKAGPLQLVQVSTPHPGLGDVLVRVVASGINPLDAKILAGTADHARQALPAILGMDMAGIVVAAGGHTTTFQAGDAVYGMAGGVGGHARDRSPSSWWPTRACWLTSPPISACARRQRCRSFSSLPGRAS